LSKDEAARLIAAALANNEVFPGLTGNDRAMLYAGALGTGFRSAELASLAPVAFDVESDVQLEAVNAKNRQK
jgi:hypothetical protein